MDNFWKYLQKIPIINTIIRFLQNTQILGLSGLSVFDLIRIYTNGIIHGALNSRAGGIAFSFLMAIFPFLIFILTVIKYIPINGFQEDFLYLLNQWLPPTTYEVAHDKVIIYITNHNYGGMISLYFVASVFLMANGVSAIFGGFENSYHIKLNRSVIRQYLVALGVSLLLAVYLLLTVLVEFYFELGIEHLKDSGIFSVTPFWIQLGQRSFFAFMIYMSISTLFYFGTAEGKENSFFSAGSIVTTLLFFLMFYFFGIYVVKFSKYHELYGSIGALLVFMLFIWLISILLLLGFELNASLNHLKKVNKSDSN